MLEFTPDFIGYLFLCLNKSKIEDFKLNAILQRIDGEELQTFGNGIKLEIKQEIKEEKPKKFDIREMENLSRIIPGISYEMKKIKKDKKDG